MVFRILSQTCSEQNQQNMWLIRAKQSQWFLALVVQVTIMDTWTWLMTWGFIQPNMVSGCQPCPNLRIVFFCMSTETHIMCRGICISIIIYIHVYIIYLYYLFNIYIYIYCFIYIIIYIYIYIHVLIVFCQQVPLLFRWFSPLFPRPSYKVSQAAGFFDHWTMATWIVTLSFTSKSLITLLGRTQHFKSVSIYIYNIHICIYK